MKPGEYTAVPIKTAFGFHVVKLIERRPRPGPSYEALSGQIRASLEAKATQDVMEDLRAKAKVEKFIPDVPLEQSHASHPAQ
ncbi:peptidylprolyl isomerase (plasmid) [Mesorhizobium atlanticum]|uniref:peptidylprolyl isomerase n=1 Tax=Mesorhizobium atlanticum TaxID=2233532 RepID=UPI003704722F